MLRVGDTVLAREKHTTWLSNTKCSALETSIQVIYRLSRLYLGLEIYTCTYMYIRAINRKKEAMNLKKSREGYMENDVIIL